MKYMFEVYCRDKNWKKAAEILKNWDLESVCPWDKKIVEFTSEVQYNVEIYKELVKKCFEESEYEVSHIIVITVHE